MRAKAFVIFQLLMQMLGSLLYDSQKATRIAYMLRGFHDGIAGKLGTTVAPTP